MAVLCDEVKFTFAMPPQIKNVTDVQPTLRRSLIDAAVKHKAFMRGEPPQPEEEQCLMRYMFAHMSRSNSSRSSRCCSQSGSAVGIDDASEGLATIVTEEEVQPSGRQLRSSTQPAAVDRRTRRKRCVASFLCASHHFIFLEASQRAAASFFHFCL